MGTNAFNGPRKMRERIEDGGYIFIEVTCLKCKEVCKFSIPSRGMGRREIKTDYHPGDYKIECKR